MILDRIDADSVPERGLHVLLVEDHAIVREIIASMLTAMGVAAVTTAEDGEAAWRLLTAHETPPVDLIITDLNMPRLSGHGLVARLRTSGTAVQSLPIIILTADERYSRVDALSGNPISSCLIKPVTPATLKTAVDAALAL